MNRWSEERVQALRRMWTVDGLSGAQIAAAIGGDLTRSAVMGKLQRVGLLGGKAVARPGPKSDDGRAFA